MFPRFESRAGFSRACYAAAFFLLITACSLFAAQLPGDIRVYQFKGRPAEIILKDGTKPPVRVGEKIPVDATIRTPEGSSLTLMFSNGATISVQPGTELQVSFLTSDPDRVAMPSPPRNTAAHTPSDTDVRLMKGLIMLDVPTQNRKSTFQVTTPLGIACIRGTRYFVQAGKNLAIVGVVSGKVLATSLAGDSKLLVPGTAVAMSPAGFIEAGPAGASLLHQTLSILNLLSPSSVSALPAPSKAHSSRASYNLSE